MAFRADAFRSLEQPVKAHGQQHFDAEDVCVVVDVWQLFGTVEHG